MVLTCHVRPYHLSLVFYLSCFKSPSGVDLLASPYAVHAKTLTTSEGCLRAIYQIMNLTLNLKLVMWLIMSGFMDLRWQRVAWRSNMGLVHLCNTQNDCKIGIFLEYFWIRWVMIRAGEDCPHLWAQLVGILDHLWLTSNVLNGIHVLSFFHDLHFSWLVQFLRYTVPPQEAL